MERLSSKRRARWAGALGALAVLLAACGGGAGDGSTNGTTQGSSGDPGVVRAREATDALIRRPTQITNTTPISGQVPAGKTIAWIQCPTPSCVQLGVPLKAATDAVGWDLEVITHNGTPEGVKAAYRQAVTNRVDGVVGSGFPRTIFDVELRELAAAGVPVVQLTMTDPPVDGITAVINGPARNAQVGVQLANFVVSDTDGNADVLWVTADYPILVPEYEGLGGEGGFKPTLEANCSGCTTERLAIPATSVGSDAPARIVSHLQANPQINYVVGAFSDLVGGLPGALRDAGLAGSVDVATYTPNPAISAAVQAGEVQAVVGFPGPENMWQAVDTFIRSYLGQPFEKEFNDLPSWVITSDDVPSTTSEFPLVADYQKQYKALWGIR